MIIIGASSFIGKYLYEHYTQKGEEVVGTYYNNPQKNLIKFNIKEPNILNINTNLKKHKYAFICSAISQPDRCKKEIKESYDINVKGTRELLRQLLNEEIFPIFFSSEYVFDGKIGNYLEHDERNPNTIYGNQKKEIEDFLMNNNKSFLIARLGKVFSLKKEDKTILTSIIEQLTLNREIKCATDQIFCPIYIQDLIQVLDLSIERNLGGIYNLASPEKFSRYELAKLIKSKMNISSVKISPCSIKEFNFLDKRPLNTSLNTQKIQEDSGFKFTSLEDSLNILKEVFRVE